jgi:hypothetical protein
MSGGTDLFDPEELWKDQEIPERERKEPLR